MGREPRQFRGFPAELSVLAPYGPYRGVVGYIVDGDTLDVWLSIGFNQYPYQAMRVIDLHAPEIYKGTPAERAEGQKWKAELATLLPEEKPCIVETDKDKKTFDRYVARIKFIHEGQVVDLATIMGERGFAIELEPLGLAKGQSKPDKGKK